MITRRLVAAPSRALFTRCMATAAVLEAADSTTASTSHSSPSNSTSRSRLDDTHGRRHLDGNSRQGTSSHVQTLLRQIERPYQDCEPGPNAPHEVAWRNYKVLTRQERSSLTSAELARILRSVVPRYHNYWKVLYNTPKRSHFRVMSGQIATDWETRLRTVMGDLAATDSVNSDDWWFVLQTLGNMGLLNACESICRDMPENLRYHPRTSEIRLGAVVRWARNIIDEGRRPTLEQVELAHNTFWEIFRHMKSDQIHAFTLRLLVSATAEVATLLKTSNNAEALERMRTLVNYVVLQGYGIDLDNLAMSVDAPVKNPGTPPLSAKGLNAILRHLVVRNVEPYRLVSAFELLSVRQPLAAAVQRSRMYEEDEDDFGPVGSESSADVQDPERRNWMGFKVDKGTPPAFFDESASSLPSSAVTEPSEEPRTDEIPQSRRYRADFLSPIPSLSSVSTRSSTRSLADKPTYNDEGIVIILNYLRARRETRLFFHVLETALYSAKASQAAWLSSYISCPPEKRSILFQPLRVAPEWFRIALAYSGENYNRWAKRFSRSIDDALQWTTSLAHIIIETEVSRGVAPITKGSERPTLPTPDFATNPREFRMLRNSGIFIASEALSSLYHDVDDLAFLASRAKEFETRRSKSYQ